jgi:predicted methyltransferase
VTLTQRAWRVAVVIGLCGFGAPLLADIGAALDVSLAGSHRSDANKARDQYRHPKETLMFFGLEPQMRVVEMLPGGEGWYTEVLAPTLRATGQFVTVTPPANSSIDYLREQFTAFNTKLDTNPALYDKVERRTMSKEKIDLGPAGSADMVVTFRSTHNWIRGGQLDAVYKAIFEVLKPGGILGIEQHRAKEGADPKIVAESGYVPQAYLISYLESVGFKLVGTSEINANPKDTKDYADGVWTLPPVLTLGDKDRAKYLAIGESDRMTLKFVKP